MQGKILLILVFVRILYKKNIRIQKFNIFVETGCLNLKGEAVVHPQKFYAKDAVGYKRLVSKSLTSLVYTKRTVSVVPPVPLLF